MIHLLDANLLIAVLDPHHAHHQIAHRWIGSFRGSLKWATCPLTENAFVRITGNPTYPNSFGSTMYALDKLKENCSQPEHVFWPDELSIRQTELWSESGIANTQQITDCYLLALAVKNGGKLASLDRHIPAHLVRGGAKALLLLPV
jgi:toxin-antitoxin system PIN domain toxin